MFNEIKLKGLAKLLNIKDISIVEAALKSQAKYLKTGSTFLLNSYITMIEAKEEYEKNKLEVSKLKTKNLVLQKYKEEVLEMYMSGFGYLKISNAIYLNHNAKISKSSIENFIKQNNIKRPKIG